MEKMDISLVASLPAELYMLSKNCFQSGQPLSLTLPPKCFDFIAYKQIDVTMHIRAWASYTEPEL